MKTDPKARYQGYAFYFREGFCWNNVLNPQARLLKAKLKRASVNDVGSMSLMPLISQVPSKFIIALLNSNLIFDYYRVFVNCSVNIQINDLRQIPVVIPDVEQLEYIIGLVDKAITIKEKSFRSNETEITIAELEFIESEIDKFINNLYHNQQSV